MKISQPKGLKALAKFDKFDAGAMPINKGVVMKRSGPAPKLPTGPIKELAGPQSKVNTNHSAYSAGMASAYEKSIAAPKQDFHTGVRSARAIPTPKKGQH